MIHSFAIYFSQVVDDFQGGSKVNSWVWFFFFLELLLILLFPDRSSFIMKDDVWYFPRKKQWCTKNIFAVVIFIVIPIILLTILSIYLLSLSLWLSSSLSLFVILQAYHSFLQFVITIAINVIINIIIIKFVVSLMAF